MSENLIVQRCESSGSHAFSSNPPGWEKNVIKALIALIKFTAGLLLILLLSRLHITLDLLWFPTQTLGTPPCLLLSRLPCLPLDAQQAN